MAMDQNIHMANKIQTQLLDIFFVHEKNYNK